MSIKLTNVQKRAIIRVYRFKPITKEDKTRKHIAIKMIRHDVNRLIQGLSTDSGLYGKIAELLEHKSTSKVTRVQKQGHVDVYIRVNGERVNCDYKTNGGRIGELYERKNIEQCFIVYELDFTTPKRIRKDGTTAGGERRYCKKIMKLQTFLNILEECKAIKMVEHKGYFTSDKEPAIQCSSKKLYNALQKYADYERNMNYGTK